MGFALDALRLRVRAVNAMKGDAMTRWLVVMVAGLLAACGQVDQTERATFSKWGQMDQKCYGPGFYTYSPLGTDMDTIHVGTQKYEAKGLAAATADLQEIHADVVVNFSIDPDNCHKMFDPGQAGHNYLDKVIIPATSDSLKAATAHFGIDKIIRERGRLREEFEKDMRTRVGKFYLRIESVNLTNFAFAKSFSDAVEKRQVEEQRVQEAEYRRQQAVKNAEAAVALADGQAKANKLLAESLKQSPETIEFRKLEVREKEIAKWNGVLPHTIFGGGAVPLVSTGK